MRTTLLITLLILVAIVTCMLMIRVERAFLLGNTTTTTQAPTGNTTTTTRPPTGNTTTTRPPTENTTTTRPPSKCDMDPNKYMRVSYDGDPLESKDMTYYECARWCNENPECGGFDVIKNLGYRSPTCRFKKVMNPFKWGMPTGTKTGIDTYTKPGCWWRNKGWL